MYKGTHENNLSRMILAESSIECYMKILIYYYAYMIDYFHAKVNTIKKKIMQGGVHLIYFKIRKKCEERGISIYRLEKDLGFSPSTVIKWKKSIPAADKLKAVADYLNIPIEELLDSEEVK